VASKQFDIWADQIFAQHYIFEAESKQDAEKMIKEGEVLPVDSIPATDPVVTDIKEKRK
jgi:hypothetical protein